MVTPATPSPRPEPGPRVLRWLERALFVLGIVALGYYGYVQAEAFLYQRFENRELDRILHAQVHRAAPAEQIAPVSFPAPAAGSRIGRIEIPRLEMSAIVLAGTDAATLRRSVGYIPGTALPGMGGNVGLAAHRDTFFRRLKDIRMDDEVVMTTERGVYRYRVARTQIVNPSDVWVLDPTPTPTLTLVTCYPFTYIGSAPQRFIVQASLQP